MLNPNLLPDKPRNKTPIIKNSLSKKDFPLIKRRKVSWGTKNIQEYIKENSIDSQNILSPINEKIPGSPSDMDISEAESLIMPNFKPLTRKNAMHLIMEFEAKVDEIDSEIHESITREIESYEEEKNIINTEVQETSRSFDGPNSQIGKKNLLAPVKEESESIHSSGGLIEKATKIQPFCHELDRENANILSKDTANNDDSPVVSLRNIEWAFPPMAAFEKPTIKCDLYNLAELKEKEIRDEKEIIALTEKTQIYLEKLKKITKNIEKPNKLYEEYENHLNQISSKDYKPSEAIDQVQSPRKAWLQTYTKRFSNGSITYFRHQEFIKGHIMLKYLIISFDNREGRNIIDYHLYVPFKNEDLQKLFRHAFEDYKNRLEIYDRHEALKKISDYWINFLKFSDNFEVMQLAFDYASIKYLQSKFVLKGNIFGKDWVYELSYAEIDTNWDIIASVGNEVQASSYSCIPDYVDKKK